MSAQNKNKNNLDRIIIAIAAIVFIFTLYLLNNDHLLQNRDIFKTKNLTVIGKIKKITNNSDRRIGDDLVWSPTRAGDKLYENDHIFTHENSEAQIELGEGVDLTVSEKSLIVLEKKKDVFELKIKNGTTKIKLSKGAKLQLNNKGQSVELSTQEIASTVEISSNESGEFEIKSTEGTMDVKTENNASIPLLAGEVFQAEEKLEEEVVEEEEDIPVVLVEPPKKTKEVLSKLKIENEEERKPASVEEKSVFDFDADYNRKYNFDLGLDIHHLQLTQVSNNVKLSQNSASVRGTAFFKIIPDFLEFGLTGYISALSLPYESQNIDKVRTLRANVKLDYILPIHEDGKQQLKLGLGWLYWNLSANDENASLRALNVYAPALYLGFYDYGSSERRKKNIQLSVSLIKDKSPMQFGNKDLSIYGQYQLNAPISRIPIYWTLGFSHVYFYESVIKQFEFQVITTGISFGL